MNFDEVLEKVKETWEPDAHNKDCNRAITEWIVRAGQFIEAHPKFCRKCLGAGVHEYQENRAPHGSGHYWPETMREPCEECECKGICPICGEETVDEDGNRSCKCESFGIDLVPECLCWMSELEDYDEGVR